MKNKFRKLFLDILKMDIIRYYFCYLRWIYLRKRLKIHSKHSAEVADFAISYNLTAFAQPKSAFGMAKRMSLIIFPMAAILRAKPQSAVLIVGPRTEDDIFWARSLGMSEAKGFDLFSYSPIIDVGDMHSTGLPDNSQDAVLLGWVLAYSTQPDVAVAECKRILRPGGYLAIGMESLTDEVYEKTKANRANRLNNLDQLKSMVNEELIFIHDPKSQADREVAAIFRISK